MLALLYDIHGNLPALEAVLADASDVDGFLLGGDYATAGAWPKETVERLKELENATWIRGNADRWLVDRSRRARRRSTTIAARTAELLGDELVEELSAPSGVGRDRRHAVLPRLAALGHGDLLPRGPASGTRSCSTGVEARRVVAGHIHIAFRRAGPGGIELVNPGSVGMPWDGDHRAAYAVIDDDRVEQRRVDYDWQKAVAAVRDWVGELPARRMELARFQVD